MIRNLIFNIDVIKQILLARRYALQTKIEERIKIANYIIRDFKDMFLPNDVKEEFNQILMLEDKFEVKEKCKNLANKIAGNFSGSIMNNRDKLYKIFALIFVIYKILTIKEESV